MVDRETMSPSETESPAGKEGDLLSCQACPLKKQRFCSALIGTPAREDRLGLRSVSVIGARQFAYKANEQTQRFSVLQSGWAVRFTHTHDGRRQVLALLLPGDILGLEVTTKGIISHPILALTQLQLCTFRADDFNRIASEDPGVMLSTAAVLQDVREGYEARIVDLGRSTAEERIARLILDIKRRLDSTDMISSSERIPFPLRQQTIADMLGLTQVHVSRVMSQIRKAGLISLDRETLEIRDMDGLKRIAAFN